MISKYENSSDWANIHVGIALMPLGELLAITGQFSIFVSLIYRRKL
jgi:hypothetical protein